ncbi:WD40 repeat domain-containing protein [Amycolatopsis tucumanensis]|uniref:WD40 repeat protein n=1 Tax=Amycolatopsis tucumanensis TaxID=401106 RepID=A0ABP7HGH3_9PSEU|nr:WD40 repeat domain-containing protein [Amycolatopsis tucumanensis]MCF6423716.1 WD40 repeat domain-containing protein [Amycolatopsis tucumanensis]
MTAIDLTIDALVAASVSTEDIERAGSQLYDHRNVLVNAIRAGVARDDAAALRALCYEKRAAHTILNDQAPPPAFFRAKALAGAPFEPRAHGTVHAARALAALGLVLVEGDADHLEVFRRWISCCGLEVPAAPITELPATVTSRHAETIRGLAERGDLDLLTLVWMLDLDGWLHPATGKGPVRRGPSTTVLLDLGDTGQRAVLTIARLPGFPAGLVPDPSVMALSSADEEFHSALREAWSAAGGHAGHTLLWSLSDRAGPVIRVTNRSLSLAFAVLLDETRRLGRGFLGVLTVRRLRPRTAIVGQLDPDNPDAAAPVSGYEAKLAAIDEQTRVILPRKNRVEAERANARYGHGAELAFVDTWKQAARTGRAVDRRRLLTIAVVALLLIVFGAFGLYRIADSRRGDEQRRAVAADLAARAITLRETDPSLSARLGLAAHRIDPANSRAVDALRDVLQANRNVVRTWQADPARVDSVAVNSTQHRIVTSGTENTTKVWDLTTGRLTGTLPRYAYQLVAAQEQAMAAAATYDGVALFDIGPGAPAELGLLPDAACTTSDSVVAFDFTHDDTTLDVVWKDGAVSRYDVVTRSETMCRPWQDVLAPLTFTQPLPTDKVVAADIVGTQTAADADEVVLVLTDNTVVSARLGGKDAHREVRADELTGDATLVAADAGMVAVATAQGVAVWQRGEHRLLTNPAGGFGFAPRVLADAHGHLLISGDTGTALVPLAVDGWAMPDGLATLSGGAATVAAISDRDLVAGGPAGRISVIADSSGELALGQNSRTTAITFTADNKILAAEVRAGARGTNTYGPVLIDPANPVDESDGAARLPRWTYGDDEPVLFYANATASTPGLVATAGQVYGRGGVLVWKTSDHTNPRPLQLPPPDEGDLRPEQRIIANVEFSGDGSLLVARHVSGQVGIWSTRDWSQLGTLDLKPGNPRMLVRGNLGIFVEGEDAAAEIVQFDLTTRQQLHRVPAPGAFRLAADRDGSRVVSMSRDGEVQLRNPDLTPAGEPWRVPNNGAQYWEIAMNGAGTLLAVPQGDQLAIYDVDTQTLAMPPFTAEGEDIIEVAWSPDDSLIAASPLPPQRGLKNAGGLRVWKTGGLDWTKQVCRWAGGGLSQADWNRYVGDTIPYLDLCAEAHP